MSLRPRKRVIQTRSPILIVCEGDFELSYFNALKSLKFARERLSVSVELTHGGKHVKVLETVEKLSKNRSFDEIWCVFDAEGDAERTLLTATLKRCRQKKFHVALSNPCFDAWVLAHLGAWPTDRITTEKCKQMLRKQCNCEPDVCNNAWVQEKICGGTEFKKLPSALESARHFSPDEWEKILENNPSTSVGSLGGKLTGGKA